MIDLLIDVTPVTERPSGVGFYILNLVRSLQALQQHEPFNLRLSYQPSLKNWFFRERTLPSALTSYSADIQVWNVPVKLANGLFTIATLSDWLTKFTTEIFDQTFNHPQIIHGTNYSVYPCMSAKKVLSIYDLTCIKFPHYVDRVAYQYGKQIRQHLQWTDLVLTISENSKQDIVECFGIDPCRIWVTPLASAYTHSAYVQKSPPEKGVGGPHSGPPTPFSGDVQTSGDHSAIALPLAEQVLALTGYDSRQPYILFVSTLEPRKNVTGLIAAFGRLKAKYRLDHHLVLIGRKGWRYEPILEAIATSPWRQQIHHLDYLPNDVVAYFYTHADVFAYPSHYEGFGLPILEAMTFGVPVVTSNTSSLPEVGGDAVLYAEPTDPDALAAQLYRVISDTTLRHSLMIKGKARAAEFSWERTAQQTLTAYRSLFS